MIWPLVTTGPVGAHLGGRLVALAFALCRRTSPSNALKGRITPTRGDREYVRAAEPAAFWFHVAAYAVVACAFALGVAVRPRLTVLGFGASSPTSR